MSDSAAGVGGDNGFSLLPNTPLFATTPTTEVAKPSSANKKTSAHGKKSKKAQGKSMKAEVESRQKARIAAEDFADSVQV